MPGFLSGLSVLLHWSMFLFLCQHHTVSLAFCSTVWSQEGWCLQLYSCFLRWLWPFGDLLCFHMKCEMFCSTSVKNAIGNLIGIALTFWVLIELVHRLFHWSTRFHIPKHSYITIEWQKHTAKFFKLVTCISSLTTILFSSTVHNH